MAGAARKRALASCEVGFGDHLVAAGAFDVEHAHRGNSFLFVILLIILLAQVVAFLLPVLLPVAIIFFLFIAMGMNKRF